MFELEELLKTTLDNCLFKEGKIGDLLDFDFLGWYLDANLADKLVPVNCFP